VILHNSKNDFLDAISAASKQLGIRALYLEKDYWVTYVLKNLSKSKYAEQVVFKGGTSLSKAYKIIDRFSEDVDLAILLSGDESGTQLKNLIKNIENDLVTRLFKENKKHKLVSKGSKFRKTAYQYPRLVKAINFGHAYDHLILEVNSFANHSPFNKKKITSMLGDFIEGIDKKMVTEYELESFEVNVLDIKRTFTEKVMGLVRAGYEEDPKISIKNKIRHIYDLHLLLSDKEVSEFLERGFESMVMLVRSDDKKNQEFQGEWMTKEMSKSLLFKEPATLLKKLDPYYQDTFASLVYGELPSINELIFSMNKISKKLEKISIS